MAAAALAALAEVVAGGFKVTIREVSCRWGGARVVTLISTVVVPLPLDFRPLVFHYPAWHAIIRKTLAGGC